MSKEPTNRWAMVRDICAAARELMIVLAMLALILFPVLIRNSLERAGIKSVAGVEFELQTLQESRTELNEALQQVNYLEEQLVAAQSQLQSVASNARSSGNVEASPGLETVSKMLGSMQSQADDTRRTMRRSLDHTDAMIQRAGGQTVLTPPEDLFREFRQTQIPQLRPLSELKGDATSALPLTR